MGGYVATPKKLLRLLRRLTLPRTLRSGELLLTSFRVAKALALLLGIDVSVVAPYRSEIT